jgi:hypothetical protein
MLQPVDENAEAKRRHDENNRITAVLMASEILNQPEKHTAEEVAYAREIVAKFQTEVVS